jgi:hypothetical protein
MFCLSRDPKELSLNTEVTYTWKNGDVTTYCFELPGS